MKKTAFTTVALIFVAFANAQNTQVNNTRSINLTNILSNNNGNNISQTRNVQQRSNIPAAPINVNYWFPNNQQKATTRPTNKTNSVNQRAPVNQVATTAPRRRATNPVNRSNNPTAQTNLPGNQAPVVVVNDVNDNNVGNQIALVNFIIPQTSQGGPNGPNGISLGGPNINGFILNDDVQQSFNENELDNVQRKTSLPEISLPSWEANTKVKTTNASVKKNTTKHSSSNSKKHHKKKSKKLGRKLRDNGIKNMKANYELCYKF